MCKLSTPQQQVKQVSFVHGVEAPGPTLGTYIYTSLQGSILARVPEGPGLRRAAPVFRGEPRGESRAQGRASGEGPSGSDASALDW